MRDSLYKNEMTLDPYSPPLSDPAKSKITTRRSLDFVSIGLATGVYFLSMVIGLGLLAGFASGPFGVIFIIAALYLMPPTLGALFLAYRVKDRWAIHGLLYSLITSIISCILIGISNALTPLESAVFLGAYTSFFTVFTLIVMGCYMAIRKLREVVP